MKMLLAETNEYWNESIGFHLQVFINPISAIYCQIRNGLLIENNHAVQYFNSWNKRGEFVP